MQFEVIDNFLKSEDLIYLQSLLKTLNPKSDSPTSFFSKKSWSPDQNTIPTLNLLELEKNYVPHAMEVLNRLAPHKTDLVDDFAFNLQSTPPNYSYPVHLDSVTKVLSGVIYLQPAVSTGTFLHKTQTDTSGDEIPWVVNRAFFFSRTPWDSWHSYKGDGVGFRWVLVFNLLTSKLRKHEIRDRGIVGYARYRITKRSLQGVEKSM